MSAPTQHAFTAVPRCRRCLPPSAAVSRRASFPRPGHWARHQPRSAPRRSPVRPGRPQASRSPRAAALPSLVVSDARRSQAAASSQQLPQLVELTRMNGRHVRLGEWFASRKSQHCLLPRSFCSTRLMLRRFRLAGTQRYSRPAAQSPSTQPLPGLTRCCTCRSRRDWPASAHWSYSGSGGCRRRAVRAI